MADGMTGGIVARGQMRLIRQTEAAECALACLVMVANYYGHDFDLASVRRQFGTSMKGASLVRLMQVSGLMGLDAKPLRAELEYLPSLKAPVVAHWDLNHFVVIHRVTAREVEIFDPARGKLKMLLNDVGQHFTGIIVELMPSATFQPEVSRQRITLRALLGRISGLKRSAIQAVALAMVIELLSLIIPYQAQWILDEVLLTQDNSLLWVIGSAFALVVVVQTLFSIARAHVITWLGASMNSQWVGNLFRHLLCLPLSYFERRHMGDVVSKFSSTKMIQNVITGSFTETILDGATGILTLVILVAYSPPLSAIVIGGIVGYAAIRWITYQRLRIINEEQLIYGARQQSELMESVRGIQAIKLGVRNSERGARLSSATLEATERDMRSQRLGLVFHAVNQGLFSLQRVAVISIAAWLVIKAKFTAGMLVAFVAYADQFAQKVGGLVDKLVELNMLRMHGERVADIALEPPEQYLHGNYAGSDPLGRLEAHGLSFRYGPDEPWVFKELSFAIEPGEYVAITGPSGCGKSTLAKVLLGLIAPVEGSVTLGGVDIRSLGLERYRLLVGAVMQDDQLFAGSIGQNIAFFEPGADTDKIESCARKAMIHTEISRMPMGYETLVGDMGSVLSGGQKQRVLIARALYGQPKVLVLDEATSHLDTLREREINDAVKHLKVTRVTIAHRPDTIASADRVIDLGTA